MGSRSDGLSFGVLLLALVCAFSFGAIVRVATADPTYHTTCVGHGFIGGDYPTDGSYFSRIDDGCGSVSRTCGIFSYNAYRGSQTAYLGAICSAWSRQYGNYTECAGSAYTNDPGVFSAHYHYAPNWCL